MDKTDFTEEERNLILAMAHSSERKSERILAHLPWIAPGVAFIGYGVVTQQIHAVTIGALSILFYQAWGLAQELRYSAVYAAIFRKIARTFSEPAAAQSDTPEQ